MAGRQENYLEEDKLYMRFYERNLVSMLVEKELQDKIKVTDSEIEAKMKADSRLDRERAKKLLERSKSGPLVNKFYSELLAKLKVEKLRYNFPRAGQIHQRLLYRPTKERKGYWIKHSQIDEELTEEEKELVLVRFTGGKVTLFDWFMALNEMSPPNRPKDLNTIEGVERLLERAMKMPVFMSEAKLRGIDKDESFVGRVRQKGDERLLDIVKRKATAGRARPTKEEIAEYFNNHKEEFKSPDTLRIDQIWCADRETAEKVKGELAGKGNFESAKEKYSLNKGEKVFETSARREGVFFADIWKGEPNEVLGPVKGFYREGVRREIKWRIKWRVVKILAKKAGKIRKYSSGLEREAKARIRREREEVLLSNYRKELFAKYAPKIYHERIKDIDPFDIP
jgi:peptidyl-prolyl cis-trans isomerase C